MSISTLLFGQRKKTLIGFLTVDVLQSETIEMSSNSTDHPIELGFEITDNIIINPRRINATVLTSDSSILTDTLFNVSNAAFAYELLKFMHNARIPISYVSNLEIFPSMHIEKIGVPRTSASGDSLTFELSLKEIVILLPLGLSLPVTQIGGGMDKTVASLVTL